MKDKAKRPAIFLQKACFQHQFIRSRDVSTIVERPERIRAVAIGLSAAIARLEESLSVESRSEDAEVKPHDPNTLAEAVARMNLTREEDILHPSPVSIVQSHATVDLLSHPAVKYIHGDVDGDVYLEKLKSLARESSDKIMKGGSEIPDDLSQGDLYLCPESITAIEGALGTVCEAVDRVILASRDSIESPSSEDTSISRAFVAIRPPGHHCGEDTPSGFCFVNNVAVGAAHAHLQHGISRVVILDIDLHHGNGTQSIAWQINEETYRRKLEMESGATEPTQPELRVYYGSVHDILSFPCEDGKPDFIQAASTSIHKSHGQYIENVHMQPYDSEKKFWDVLYKEQYGKVLRKAEDFLDETGGPGDDVMIFISCGMDASEHEYPTMSRHNCKVPTSLYYRFARDACALSDRYAKGRIVSVLEGGYSNRALISGAMAHLCGLIDCDPDIQQVDDDWWSIDNLEKLEKATKKGRSGRASLPSNGIEPWLGRTLGIFHSLGLEAPPIPPRAPPRPPPSTITLRERKDKAIDPAKSVSGVGETRKLASAKKVELGDIAAPLASRTDSRSPNSRSSEEGTRPGGPASEGEGPKKLPRVILRLGPDPSVTSNT